MRTSTFVLSAVAIVGLALSLVRVGWAAEPELRGAPADLQRYLKPAPRTVVLAGHAKQTVQSDVGHVTVVVKTQARDLPGALKANAERRAAISRALVQTGFDAKAIRAEQFSSSPQFGFFGKTPASYEVVNRLIVDVTDDTQLIRVSEAAAASPESSVGTIDFEYTKQAELRERVRHLAFDDALARKGFYEQRLGATLKPVAFQFSDRSARGVQAQGMALEEVQVTGARRGVSNYSPPADAVPSFDEQVYEVSVDVTFELEAPKG